MPHTSPERHRHDNGREIFLVEVYSGNDRFHPEERRQSPDATIEQTKDLLSTKKKKDETNLHLLKLDVNNDEQQRSALHFAAIEGTDRSDREGCQSLLSLSLGDATIIVALYEYMHTVDVNDNLGRTPLHYAAIVGNEETLTTLLLCNPDVNRLSKDGTTALHESIIHNHPRRSPRKKEKQLIRSFLFKGAFTLLVQHNADLHVLFQDYLPSLILAVYLQHRGLVELLIRLGIDPNTSGDTSRSFGSALCGVFP